MFHKQSLKELLHQSGNNKYRQANSSFKVKQVDNYSLANQIYMRLLLLCIAKVTYWPLISHIA